jgi:hypothetical protein
LIKMMVVRMLRVLLKTKDVHGLILIKTVLPTEKMIVRGLPA